MRCEMRPYILGMSGSVGADGIDLKTDIGYSMITFVRKNYEMIRELSVDGEHPLETEEKAPLVIYYAEKGERLWDIARRYATSVSALKALNELADDILAEKKLLLISQS